MLLIKESWTSVFCNYSRATIKKNLFHLLNNKSWSGLFPTWLQKPVFFSGASKTLSLNWMHKSARLRCVLVFSHTPTQFHTLTVGSICSPDNWHLFYLFIFLHLHSPQSPLKHLSGFFIDMRDPCFYYRTKRPSLAFNPSTAAPV